MVALPNVDLIDGNPIISEFIDHGTSAQLISADSAAHENSRLLKKPSSTQ